MKKAASTVRTPRAKVRSFSWSVVSRSRPTAARPEALGCCKMEKKPSTAR